MPAKFPASYYKNKQKIANERTVRPNSKQPAGNVDEIKKEKYHKPYVPNSKRFRVFSSKRNISKAKYSLVSSHTMHKSAWENEIAAHRIAQYLRDNFRNKRVKVVRSSGGKGSGYSVYMMDGRIAEARSSSDRKSTRTEFSHSGNASVREKSVIDKSLDIEKERAVGQEGYKGMPSRRYRDEGQYYRN